MKSDSNNLYRFFSKLNSNTKVIILICLAAATLISTISLVFIDFPYIWIFLSWSIFFLLRIKGSNRISIKALFFNTGAILLILAICEAVFTGKIIKEEKKRTDIVTEGVYDCEIDDIIGSRLIKNTHHQARKYINGNLIYDVEVTIDSNGQRITPECNGCSKAILFFGGSLTFGEGVNDDEAMPYKVGLELTNEYNVYNFGVHGYGPHQMLTTIENGMVTKIVNEEVHYSIYQVIYPEHVYRLKGYWYWNQFSPRYILGKDNQPVLAGHFDEASIRKEAPELLHKLSIYRKIRDFQFPLKKRDKELFIAMLKKSQRLLKEQSPDNEFHMILWDWTDGKDKRVFDALEENGMHIHYIEDILPDRDKSNMDYKINKYDQHPNKKAHDIIAKYVVNHIIRKQ